MRSTPSEKCHDVQLVQTAVRKSCGEVHGNGIDASDKAPIIDKMDHMIEQTVKDDHLLTSMRDPFTDAEICNKPEYSIVIGVCTHLGCMID